LIDDISRLEVVLIKKIAGEFWTSVIPNEKHGVHEIGGEELERIKLISQQLEHLTSDGINRVIMFSFLHMNCVVLHKDKY